jgi:hypothetical protein
MALYARPQICGDWRAASANPKARAVKLPPLTPKMRPGVEPPFNRLSAQSSSFKIQAISPSLADWKMIVEGGVDGWLKMTLYIFQSNRYGTHQIIIYEPRLTGFQVLDIHKRSCPSADCHHQFAQSCADLMIPHHMGTLTPLILRQVILPHFPLFSFP